MGQPGTGVRRFELIEVEGEAFERGRQYGARVAVEIRQNVEAYLRLIEFHGGLEREAALRAAQAFGPILEAHTPDLLPEIRGIAEGADCNLAEILLINARSELMETMGECTALATAPEATAQGHVLLGQNWDWHTAIRGELVLLHIRQPDRPEVLTLTEAGQVGKIGMNSAGLGVCLNFLSHTDRGQGVPVHVILRQMLNCANLGEAIREAYRVPRGGAANILLAHAEGEIVDLELTAANADFHYASDGWLVHANHFESVRLRGGDTGVTTSMSTLARAARARRLLSAAAAQGSTSLDTFRSILTDHAYGAYAICRHADPTEPPLQQTATRASVIMDLTAQTMHVAAGQPCREEYQPSTLKP
jgi:isopenicillin-N N-acyltransferase-like protein